MGGLSDAWTHKVRNHGAFELGQQLGWAHSQLAAVTDEPSVRARLEAEGPADWFPDTPFRKGENPLSAAPNFEDYYLEMQNHGDYDDYFRGIGRNWAEYYEASSDIPMLHVGGWYDSYAPGTIQSFLELSRVKSAPMTLVMGPWTHGGNSRSYAGDIEFGESAAIEDFAREFHLRWFDARLKGQGAFAPFADGRLETPGAVTLFVMGGGDGHRDDSGRLFHGGAWRTAATWPLEGTEVTPFHLRAGGGLTPEAPDEDEGSSTYTYDPEHPVPTIGGAFSGALKRGGYDQRERTFRSLSGGSENGFFGSQVDGRRTADRSDVLVFETEPLAEDVEVIGPVSARLWVSSSAPDTDFTAKLVDVHPPSEDFPEGFDLNVTDGILRARYRDSRESESLMNSRGNLRAGDHPLPHREPVRGRPPDPSGDLELELPALRSEPQHRRAARPSHPHGPGRERDPPRGRTSVRAPPSAPAGRVAGGPEAKGEPAVSHPRPHHRRLSRAGGARAPAGAASRRAGPRGAARGAPLNCR